MTKPAKEKNVELEAWFVSSRTKARWPSGPLGISIIQGQPFKVTHPKQVQYFNEVSTNNEWLRKLDKKSLEKHVEKYPIQPDKDEYLENRALADDAIDDLELKIGKLKSSKNVLKGKILELEGSVSELTSDNEKLEQDRDEWKEKSQNYESDIKKLRDKLKKKKATAPKKNNGG